MRAGLATSAPRGSRYLAGRRQAIDVVRPQDVFRIPNSDDLNHRAADVHCGRHVLRYDPAQQGIERSERGVHRLVPACLRSDTSERLDIPRTKHERILEWQPYER